MKLTVVLVLCVAGVVMCRPDNILTLHNDDFEHDQSIEDGIITGSYTWTSPEGAEFEVHYIADENGFRVLDSNVVPSTLDGVLANGQQGSFLSSEETFESFEN